MTTRPAVGRLAALSVHHPRRTLLGAGVLLLLGLGLGAPVAGALSSGGFDDPNAQAAQANNAVVAATGVPQDSSIVVLVRAGSSVASGPGRDLVARVAADLRGEEQVAGVVDPVSRPLPQLVSRDGQSAYVVADVLRAPRNNEDVAQDIARRVSAAFPQTTVGGALVATRQVGDQVGKDLGRAELIAAPILFAVLVLVLRGVVVALLPLAAGALAILTTFIGLRGINAVTSLSVFALNLVTGLGLGLAIDYGLLIVNRYREEALEHGYGAAALVRAMGAAGRTVVFSALTVAAAAASLLVFPEKFLHSMGAGGILVVLVSAGVALTVTPALLAVLGERVERLGWYRIEEARARRDRHGGWYRLSRWVMRRPLAVALTTGTIMVLLGTPFLRIQFTSVDASVLPESASARQVDDALRSQFPGDTSDPVDVVAVLPGGDAAVAPPLARMAATLQGLPGALAVQPPRRLDATTWEVEVIPAQPELSAATQDLVRSVRNVAAAQPYTVLVGGATATFLDLQSSLGNRLPWAIAIVGLATLLVLWAMTGSLVLPFKAVLMNLLTISAAFGALVLVFQDGRFTGVLQYTSQGALESTQPILLFAIAFGLSTDYGVFLLNRIKEGHDAGLPTAEAVARGLERTGRLVTAAAILLAIAIGAFATSSIVFIKELGLGSALAVLIDASIVRAFLVPSLMRLLGDWNWWAPAPLRRLHRRLGLDRLEGAATAEPVAA